MRFCTNRKCSLLDFLFYFFTSKWNLFQSNCFYTYISDFFLPFILSDLLLSRQMNKIFSIFHYRSNIFDIWEKVCKYKRFARGRLSEGNIIFFPSMQISYILNLISEASVCRNTSTSKIHMVTNFAKTLVNWFILCSKTIEVLVC